MPHTLALGRMYTRITEQKVVVERSVCVFNGQTAFTGFNLVKNVILGGVHSIARGSGFEVFVNRKHSLSNLGFLVVTMLGWAICSPNQ